MSVDELAMLQRLQSTFPGKLATLEILLSIDRPDARETLQLLADQAASSIPVEAPRQSRELLEHYRHQIAAMP